MLLRKLMDIEGAAAKTVYPQIGRIFTDRFGSPRGNVYHNGNSQGGRRGEGGRDFNEQRTTLALCVLNREPLLEFTPCAPGCSMVVGRPPPYLCRLCGLKMAVTALRSYATLRLIPVVRRGLEFPPSIQETRRGRLAS